MRLVAVVVALAIHLVTSGCSSAPPVEPLRWAIAIHGGAGTLDPNAPAAELRAYQESLTRALVHGRDMLARGAPALDVCEEVVRLLEDDPLFNAGVGAVFNDRGEHELDASIMDGSTLQCGACAGVRSVRHPITLARRVMTDTPHVLLAGDGADRFAESIGLERVPNTFFDTERRRRALQQVLQERERTGALLPGDPQHRHGTVGCVVRDSDGRLAAATSTGGMTGKRWGRVGDTPVLGAGNYADRFAAVSCTGTGEEFIRHGVARTVAARMQFGGQTLGEAVHAVVHETLKKHDGGLIAVDAAGNLVADYNSTGMYRGLADSGGRFEVRIFGDQP